MDAVRKIIDNYTNPLTIDLPAEYENKKLEVIVLPIEDATEQKTSKYDFSDLVGKLEWQGDALAEQKRLRNEWD
jgi:hypothetical protein